MIVLWTGARKIVREYMFISHVKPFHLNFFSLSSLTFLSLGSHSLSHVFIMNSRTLMSVHLPNQVSDEDSGGAAAGAAAPPPETKKNSFNFVETKKETVSSHTKSFFRLDSENQLSFLK
jgi:hypothetical protein